VWEKGTWPGNAAKQEQPQKAAQATAENPVLTQWKTEESESEELFFAASTQSGPPSRRGQLGTAAVVRGEIVDYEYTVYKWCE